MGASRSRPRSGKPIKVRNYRSVSRRRIMGWVEALRETGHLAPHENADNLTVSEFCTRIELHETMLKDAADVIRALVTKNK